MDEIYIKKENLCNWIAKYFPTKDLISIDDLISVIEDLDSEKDELQEELDDLKNEMAENYAQRAKF